MLPGARAAGHLPLIELSPRDDAVLHDQVYEPIRAQIVDGRLRPGSRLASTRVLASEIGLSRFTIVTAIERLLAEGYLLARHGVGTFVADVAWLHRSWDDGSEQRSVLERR